jgi:hypothetical protein
MKRKRKEKSKKIGENKIDYEQEIPCTTEARSTFFGCTGSDLRFLGFYLQYKISVRQSTIMLYVRNLGLLPNAG